MMMMVLSSRCLVCYVTYVLTPGSEKLSVIVQKPTFGPSVFLGRINNSLRSKLFNAVPFFHLSLRRKGAKSSERMGERRTEG